MQLTQLKRRANQRQVGQLSWVELRRRRYRHFADATQLNWTQLDVESSWVELGRYKRAFRAASRRYIYKSTFTLIYLRYVTLRTPN